MNTFLKSGSNSDSGPASDTAAKGRQKNNSAVDRLLENYVACWNEPDPIKRRRLIASVWAEDGLTCYRPLESRGYQAIESRVTTSWEKSLRDGRHIFRPVKSALHHDIVKFDFDLATISEGAVEGLGLSFLILDANRRIHADLQFNPKANDAADFVGRYIATFNEPDEKRRSESIVEMWSPEAILVEEKRVRYGHSDLSESIVEFSGRNEESGLLFSAGLNSNGHHNFITFNWELRNRRSGGVPCRGSDLLILDDKRRIKIDYRFSETP
jgi:hypothetical protein